MNHFHINLRKVEYILDTILSVVRINRSLTEETDISFRPHFMILILILINSMSSLILFKNLVQPWCFNICALSNDLFTVIQQLFMLFLFFE